MEVVAGVAIGGCARGSVDSIAVSFPRSLVVSIALAALALGCAVKQRVALDCVPREVRVYVDGRALDRGTESTDLRRDRAHTVYFKGGGFEPQMVVLESRQAEDGAWLAPADVCSQTAFVPTSPRVEMQVAPEASGGTPGS